MFHYIFRGRESVPQRAKCHARRLAPRPRDAHTTHGRSAHPQDMATTYGQAVCVHETRPGWFLRVRVHAPCPNMRKRAAEAGTVCLYGRASARSAFAP